MTLKLNSILFMVFVVCALASCNKTESKPSVSTQTISDASFQSKISENGTNPDEAIFNTVSSSSVNHFYILSNRKGKNSVFVFSQKTNGQLILDDEVASGGSGLSDGLGSQGAIAISRKDNLLFAVNPASNSISSFRINASNGGLKLLFTANSNGQVPNSITVFENKLYVLNNLSSSVSGYTFTSNGFLSPIANSIHNLSGANVDAPQIKFQPDGYAVYVTEKVTCLIDKFTLNAQGEIIAAKQITPQGIEPFGFDYARNNQFMVVTNAANGFSGAGSCTSYKFTTQGLTDINGAVSDFETAPCWIATTKYGAFGFVANTTTNNISSYYIDKGGVLTLIKAVAAANGTKPIDIAVSADNKYVYSIYSGSHTLVSYKRQSAGEIVFSDKVTSLPPFAAGLAVY